MLAFHICLIKITFTQFLFLIISRYLLPGTLYSGLFTQRTADKLNLAKRRVQTSSPALSWWSCHHCSCVGGHKLPPASIHIQIYRKAHEQGEWRGKNMKIYSTRTGLGAPCHRGWITLCLPNKEQASGQTISPELVSISCSGEYSTNRTNAACVSVFIPYRGVTAPPCRARRQAGYL